MKDLTQGSISRHLVSTAVPIMAGMLLQTMYNLIDLHFVSGLGETAIAGVSAAGNVSFLIMALTQTLGVGVVALISHAVGRKDQADANLIFNQSLALAAVCVGLTCALGYGGGAAYLRTLSADAATAEAGTTFLYWFLPGMALQFAIVTMGSALRGTGIVKPTMLVQALTVLLNILLAPVLIAGWGTGRPLGVAGAGLATSLSVLVGVVVLARYFQREEKYVSAQPSLWRPRLEQWGRILKIGLPAGGEFGLMFVTMAVVVWVIRSFGAASQAGFGVGMRVMQAIFLPAMAVAFAVAPIVGQNFGARRPERIRAAFGQAALVGSGVMFLLTLVCHWRPEALIRLFSTDAEVVAVGAQYLNITSWNFVASGLLFTCSSVFQGLGNTRPSLLSSGFRLVIFALPALWFSQQSWFRLEHLWKLSVTTVALQALLSLWLVRRQFRRVLPTLATPDPTPATPPPVGA